MPPEDHSKLSPSSSERWLSCPASIRMSAGVESEETVYAREGTAAHALGELLATRDLLGLSSIDYRLRLNEWQEQFEDFRASFEEMELHAEAYVDLIRERLAAHPNSFLLLEQRMATGVPECRGTSDAVIVSPEHVEIIDLKYGQGVRVEAEGNPQLRLYGLGALDTFGDLLGEVRTVFMTVFQPRRDSVSTASMGADELRAWRQETVLPVAELALGADAPFGPSEEACRFCPVSGKCRPQMEFAVEADFGRDTEQLGADDFAELVPLLPFIRKWCEAVEAAALELNFNQRTPIPGLKTVLSGGRRVISDPVAALDHLVDLGFELDEVSTWKLNGLGALEKVLGKGLPQLKDFITYSEGRPSLVPEGDRRPAITPESEAAKDFTPEPEGTEE